MEFRRDESDWLIAVPLHIFSRKHVHIANWSDREIETAIKETFTKLGCPAVNPEELEAVKEFVKGKDVFVSTLYGSGKSLCYGSLPLVFDYLHPAVPHLSMSTVVVVSPLKALALDQVTCKHLVHTGPGMSCILVCPTSLHNRSKAAVVLSELEHCVGSCNHRSGRNRVDKDRKVYCL